MARGYTTARPEFIDYLPDLGKVGGKGGQVISDLFGEVEALPEDRPRLMEVMNEYEQQANELTRQMLANPRQVGDFKLKAQNLASSINQELTAGELRAIRDRKKQYDERVKYYQDNLKDDPLSMQQAIKTIQVPPLNFNKSTGAFGRIGGYDVVKPFTTEDRRKLQETMENTVKDKVLARIDDVKKLDNYTSVWQAGQELGVTEQDVYRSFAGMVSPDMIKAEQQKYDLAGIPANEQEFYTQDAQGNLTPNLSTTFGRMMYSLGEQLKRSKSDVDRTTVKDEAGLIGLRGREQRRTLSYKKKLDEPDVKWMVDKVEALYKGDEDAFNKVVTLGESVVGEVKEKSDNFLKGFKLEDGSVIQSTRKVTGEIPQVLVSRDVTTTTGGVKPPLRKKNGCRWM